MMSVVLMGMSEHERLQTLEHRRAVSCVYRLLPLYPYDATMTCRSYGHRTVVEWALTRNGARGGTLHVDTARVSRSRRVPARRGRVRAPMRARGWYVSWASARLSLSF